MTDVSGCFGGSPGVEVLEVAIEVSGCFGGSPEVVVLVTVVPEVGGCFGGSPELVVVLEVGMEVSGCFGGSAEVVVLPAVVKEVSDGLAGRSEVVVLLAGRSKIVVDVSGDLAGSTEEVELVIEPEGEVVVTVLVTTTEDDVMELEVHVLALTSQVSPRLAAHWASKLHGAPGWPFDGTGEDVVVTKVVDNTEEEDVVSVGVVESLPKELVVEDET